MPARLEAIVADVLGIPEPSVSDETSPDTEPEWTSLAHINLVLALEAEYRLALSLEDAMDMLSVRLIRLILAEKGITLE